MNNRQSPPSFSMWSTPISLLILLIVSLFAPGPMSAVSAQTVPTRPVARLITSTSDEINHSRARRGSSYNNRRFEVSSASSFPSVNRATETERRAFEATNKMRAKNGVSALNWDDELCRLARAHSEKMGRLGFFAHNIPEGQRLKDRARTAKIRFQVIGENIAYNQGVDDPGSFAVERWMISSGHRANILRREFRSSGVGSFVSQDGKVFLTQIFIAP